MPRSYGPDEWSLRRPSLAERIERDDDRRGARRREVERDGVWLCQTRDARAPRPVEPAHEDQLTLEVMR